MVSVENASRYRLVDIEAGEEVLSARDVVGFFGGERSSTVSFLGVGDIRRRKSADAVLQVLGRRRDVIGEYHVGQVVLDAHALSESPARLSCKVFSSRTEFAESREIWRRWSSEPDLRRLEWVRGTPDYQEAWLDVVQKSWFATGREVARCGDDDVVYLDGRTITTKAGLYCALGEAVNGPGGYYGSSLDAVAEFLSSGSGAPLGIVWQDYALSRASLPPDYAGKFLDVLREFGVRVDLK